MNGIRLLIDPNIMKVISEFSLILGTSLIIMLPAFIYDDATKVYLTIQKGVVLLFIALTIIIIGNTDIGVVKDFWGYDPKITLKYMINVMPLIFIYPFVHAINEYNYKTGVYRRFIKRRIKNVI